MPRRHHLLRAGEVTPASRWTSREGRAVSSVQGTGEGDQLGDCAVLAPDAGQHLCGWAARSRRGRQGNDQRIRPGEGADTVPQPDRLLRLAVK